MNRLPFLIFVACTVLLASCASPEQQARWDAQRQAEAQAREQSNLDVWRKRCGSYGYREGTDQFASCMQTEARSYESRVRDQQARQDKAQRNLACLAGDKNRCDNKPTVTNCTRDILGNVQCTSQ